MRIYLKSFLLILFTIGLFLIVSCAPEDYLSDSRVDRLGVHSEILEKTMFLEIYVPRGYGDSDVPVLYMLHDYAQNEKAIRDSEMFDLADIMIEQGMIEPMLIVSPQIDNSYLLNSSEKCLIHGNSHVTGLYSGRYEDYLTDEVMKYIEDSYNVVKDESGRFIGGISTGGYAALRMAFANPDMFSKVGGHMPAVWTPEMSLMEMDLLGWLYPTEASRLQRDPAALAYKNNLGNLEIYLDCGDKDNYSGPGVQNLYDTLVLLGYDCSLSVNEGKHNQEYISQNIMEYLRFYAGIADDEGGNQ